MTLDHPPIAAFVRYLRDRYGLSTLVETGTFVGESTRWAAQFFDRVVTIDIRADYQLTALATCEDFPNVEFRYGDSRSVLPEVVDALTGPALFWLDAHAAPGLFGTVDDWPVLDELDAIFRSLPMRHFVLIDDAHCFLPDTPYPACPSLKRVLIEAVPRGYISQVRHDVIVLVPATEADVFAQFGPV